MQLKSFITFMLAAIHYFKVKVSDISNAHVTASEQEKFGLFWGLIFESKSIKL